MLRMFFSNSNSPFQGFGADGNRNLTFNWPKGDAYDHQNREEVNMDNFPDEEKTEHLPGRPKLLGKVRQSVKLAQMQAAPSKMTKRTNSLLEIGKKERQTRPKVKNLGVYRQKWSS